MRSRSSCVARAGWPCAAAQPAVRAACRERSSRRWPSGSPAAAAACSPARRPGAGAGSQRGGLGRKGLNSVVKLHLKHVLERLWIVVNVKAWNVEALRKLEVCGKTLA